MLVDPATWKLNPEQRRAVDYGAGPLMVLAGAGTGKTRVLVYRIARLVARGVEPWEILAVTFTNKAAGEMRARLTELLDVRAARMWVYTFHATCARLLRYYRERAGLSRDFSIFDDDDQRRLLHILLKENGLEDAMTPRTLITRIDRAKNRGQDPCAVSRGYGDDVIQTIYPLYQARLARENAVDFNDLLLEVTKLTSDPVVGPELTSRFRYVLVDEFQDTNRIQYQLVRHLSRGTHNLTVVGDDDQSIYSWRGAEPRNLLDFDRDFPDAEVIKLEQNYRSTQVILDGSNGVIAHNFDRRGKALWTEREGGEPIIWEEVETEREEADFIARAMIGLVNEEGRAFGDLAILYRTHAQSRVLEEQLRRYKIAYRIVGGVSFFQRKEVKDTMAYLRLLVNPAADLALERVINVPARGVGKTTVDRVRAHAKAAKLSMLDAIREESRGTTRLVGAAARKKLIAFLDVVDGLRDVYRAGASVAELVIQTVERTGYRARLEREDTPEARDRLGNLAELVSMASDFDDETEGGGTLIDFDERLSLSSANDQAEGAGTTATLMTIHAAKGLEFPVVFLCGMEDGLFPSLRRREPEDDDAGRDTEGDELEEERRLGYVALTRAMDRLILTSARTRRHWREIRANRPSRFIGEIPEGCLAVRARPQPRRPPPRSRWQRGDEDRAGHADGFGPGPELHFDQRSGDDELERGDDEQAVGVAIGAQVTHASFGAGKVLQARGEGKERKLLIQFSGVGLKTVLARYVNPA